MAVLLNNGTNILKHTRIIGIAYVNATNYSSDVKPFNLTALKRGTGGRSSFNGIVATIFGATGFVGRYVCNRLGKIGTQVIIPYRGDAYDVRSLRLCGDLGQVLFQPYYLRNEEDLAQAVKYSNVVINLIGRDWETRNFKFQDVHVDGARAIARAAKKAGVQRFIHVSALNGTERPKPFLKRGGSKFLASKWRGEQAVLKEFPEATIFRPADVYGQEDRFLNFYTHDWRLHLRTLVLWKKGEQTIKQPVFVSDLATGIVNAIKDPDTVGKIYQAVGPKRYYLSDLVDWFYKVMKKDGHWGYKRHDLRWAPLFKLKVTLTGRLCPNFPIGNMHWERFERECITDTVDSSLPTLEDLGVNLMPMEDQVPWELYLSMFEEHYTRECEDFKKRPPPPKLATDYNKIN